MLESIILGMVSDNDFTGYDIKKLIENGIGVFYKASYGSLYPALKRLTDKGCFNNLRKTSGRQEKNFLPHHRRGTKTVFRLAGFTH